MSSFPSSTHKALMWTCGSVFGRRDALRFTFAAQCAHRIIRGVVSYSCALLVARNNALCRMHSFVLYVEVRTLGWITTRQVDGGRMPDRLPGCHFGRLGVSAEDKKHNVFMSSTLALLRRTADILELPPLAEMMEAESLNADADVHSRDRPTWSGYELSSQKGPSYWSGLFGSLFDIKVPAKHPVVIIDLTPGNGDAAMACYNFQTKGCQVEVYYMGLWPHQKDFDWSIARVTTTVTKGFLAKNWLHPTIQVCEHSTHRCHVRCSSAGNCSSFPHWP